MHVEAGEIVCLLGPNGAGKSTTLKILTGIHQADQGTATVCGQPAGSKLARQCTGLTPQDLEFPTHLTPTEILELVRSHYIDPEPTSRMVELLGMQRFQHQRTLGLSGGEKRRLALACALIGKPRALFLDEPTTGMDVESRQIFWQTIRVLQKQNQTAIVLTTHYLAEAEELSDRLLLIQNGKIIKEGTLQSLRQEFEWQIITADYPDVEPLKISQLQTGGDWTQTSKSNWRCWTRNSDQVVQNLVEAKISFKNLRVSSPSLEEIFVQLSNSGSQN